MVNFPFDPLALVFNISGKGCALLVQASKEKVMAIKKPAAGLVYSSEAGRMCPACRRPITGCVCRKATASLPAGDGIVRVGRETKGRKGKGVTLIKGVPLPVEELKTLARELKARCGSGGTLKDGVIEIQGDHREVLIDLLKARGWTVKRSGG